MGVCSTMDRNSFPDHRESPYKLWDTGHSLVDGLTAGLVVLVCTDDVTRRAFLATLFKILCLSTCRWETRCVHVLEKSWGNKGLRGEDFAKMPCRLGRAAAQACPKCHFNVAKAFAISHMKS